VSWVSVHVLDRHNTVLYRFIITLIVCTLPPLPLVTLSFFSHTESWFREDTEHSRAQGSVGYGHATHSFRANRNNFVSITSLSKR